MKSAAFIIAPIGGGETVAAVTRDRGDADLGLPGGKVEPGEEPLEAALREAREEGWAITRASAPTYLWIPRHLRSVVTPGPGYVEVYRAIIDGTDVSWLYLPGATARPLRRYKERKRGIVPVSVHWRELCDLGNDRALAVFAALTGWSSA